MNQQLMRGQYQTGIRAKGFAFTTVVGTQERQISLSGLGREILGVAVHGLSGVIPDVTLTFKINNDVILDSIPAQAIARNEVNPRQYFDAYRPLTGQDSILLQVTDGTGGQNFNFTIWYTQRHT
jgi:hypothetical protein